MQLRELIQTTGYYRIRVLPNQAKTEVRGVMADKTIKLAIKAVPEKGKANQELIRFFATELNLPKSQIRISSGLTNRTKVVFVEME